MSRKRALCVQGDLQKLVSENRLTRVWFAIINTINKFKKRKILHRIDIIKLVFAIFKPYISFCGNYGSKVYNNWRFKKKIMCFKKPTVTFYSMISSMLLFIYQLL